MVKNTVLVKIKQILSSHERFEASDFSVSYQNEGRGMLVSIKFLGEAKYKINFLIPTRIQDGFYGEMSPGSVSLNEEFKEKEMQNVYNNILQWQRHIWSEIEANPIVPYQNQQKAILDDLVSRFDAKSTEYYTVQEGEDLKHRLDDLEKQYRDLLKNIIEDTKEREAQFKAMKKDIETLKVTVTAVNKGFWNRSLLGKMVKWGANKDNQQTVKGLIDLGSQVLNGQRLLGE